MARRRLGSHISPTAVGDLKKMRPGGLVHMPKNAKRLCLHPGCSRYAQVSGYCWEHRPKRFSPKRPSPSKRGYDWAWRRIRETYLLLHPRCAICGAPATEVHHIVPISRGGTHSIENLMGLCKQCHSRLTARSLRRVIRAQLSEAGRGRGGIPPSP